MTTRELYSSIGVSGYEHQGCWRKDGVFHFRMEAPPSCHKCPKCGNREVIHRGTLTRIVHAAPIGKDRTVLFIKAPRLECRRCEQVLNAVLPNVVPLCNHTKAVARHVVDLRKMMTIRDVAQYMGVSDTMIRSIDKKCLQKTFCKPRLRDLEIIAIDSNSGTGALSNFSGFRNQQVEARNCDFVWQWNHWLDAVVSTLVHRTGCTFVEQNGTEASRYAHSLFSLHRPPTSSSQIASRHTVCGR